MRQIAKVNKNVKFSTDFWFFCFHESTFKHPFFFVLIKIKNKSNKYINFNFKSKFTITEMWNIGKKFCIRLCNQTGSNIQIWFTLNFFYLVLALVLVMSITNLLQENVEFLFHMKIFRHLNMNGYMFFNKYWRLDCRL